MVTVNFLALILGVSTGLAALGLDSRLAAAGGERVYMYSAMRWLVFRDRRPAPSGDGTAVGATEALARPSSIR